jgi:hypothetical protein
MRLAVKLRSLTTETVPFHANNIEVQLEYMLALAELTQVKNAVEGEAHELQDTQIEEPG